MEDGSASCGRQTAMGRCGHRPLQDGTHAMQTPNQAPLSIHIERIIVKAVVVVAFAGGEFENAVVLVFNAFGVVDLKALAPRGAF